MWPAKTDFKEICEKDNFTKFEHLKNSSSASDELGCNLIRSGVVASAIALTTGLITSKDT